MLQQLLYDCSPLQYCLESIFAYTSSSSKVQAKPEL